MIRVKFKRSLFFGGKPYKEGEIVDLPDDSARRLIAYRDVSRVKVEEKVLAKPETSEAKNPVKTATAPQQKIETAAKRK